MHMNGFVVEGRQFRVKTDYEAALRDKEIIDRIRKNVDFKNKDEVMALYSELESGKYRFESPVGNDFDDEIFELVQSIKDGTFVGNDVSSGKTSGKAKSGKSKGKTSKSGNSKDSKTGTGKNIKKKNIKLEDFDEDMQKHILAELHKQEKRRKLLVVLCSLMAVACFAYFGLYHYFIERTDNTYEQWAELREKDANKDVGAFAQVTVNKTEADKDVPDILEKYKTLYNKNKSLIGWIKIADTNIDYPVMQTSNNDYYLDHNLNQEYDKNGSIFMDKDCDVIKPSTNLIIYGHHMQSGKMFGQLDKYSKESYYKEHPIIEFDTIYEEGRWEIMYVFRSKIYTADDIVFKYYQFIDANSAEEFYSNMNEMSKLSLYDTGVTAEYGDELLTLSTCDYMEEDGRFVVVAKKIK